MRFRHTWSDIQLDRGFWRIVAADSLGQGCLRWSPLGLGPRGRLHRRARRRFIAFFLGLVDWASRCRIAKGFVGRGAGDGDGH